MLLTVISPEAFAPPAPLNVRLLNVPGTAVCAALPAYSIVPPQVLPLGIGVVLVVVGTDVLIVPLLLMVASVPDNTPAVDISRVAPFTTVSVPAMFTLPVAVFVPAVDKFKLLNTPVIV